MLFFVLVEPSTVYVSHVTHGRMRKAKTQKHKTTKQEWNDDIVREEGRAMHDRPNGLPNELPNELPN